MHISVVWSWDVLEDAEVLNYDSGLHSAKGEGCLVPLSYDFILFRHLCQLASMLALGNIHEQLEPKKPC